MVNTLLTTDGKDSSSSVAGSSTGSHLIPRTLFSEMIMALKRNLVLRSLAARVIGPSSIPGSSIDLPDQKVNTLFVNRISEGAVIPQDTESYGSRNIKPFKYGVRIGITSEMMEDSLFDVMALNIETAAQKLAENEETLIIAALDAAVAANGTAVANSNATLPITDITEAIQGLESNNASATHMIVGAEIANDLRNTDSFTEADKSGTNDPSKKLVGTIFNMKVVQSNAVSTVIAYLIDSSKSFVIIEKRPVTIERYKDFSRDMEFAVATQRVAAAYWNDVTVAKITTT